MVHDDFMTELIAPAVQAAAVREAASPYADEMAALRSARQQTKRAHPFLDDKQVEYIIDSALRQREMGQTYDDFDVVVAREAAAYSETVPFDATAEFDALLSSGRR